MTEPTHRPSLLVFSDLDGTLLDETDYGHAAAAPALRRLAEAGVPVVPVTSKTRAELAALREALGLLHTPFVVENGGAALLPAASDAFDVAGLSPAGDGLRRHAFGRTHAEVVARLAEAGLHERFRWRGFAQMDAGEIAGQTGLAPEQARAAARREYCEPLLWQDDAARLPAFREALAALGLRAVAGGRFLHVMDAGIDKGRAVAWLARRWRGGGTPLTVALGDSENDAGMLEAADVAVVRSLRHPFPEARGRQRTLRTRACGPAGWAEAVEQILGERG